jgi:hypothetical protein
MIRNVSEAAVLRLALRTGGVTALQASQALCQVRHPSADNLQAARAMLMSLRIRGVMDFRGCEVGFHFTASDDVLRFLSNLGFDLTKMGDAELLEEFGEYQGQRIVPADPVKINLQSYKAARNAEKRAKRQLWQCPSPWDYAQRIQDELKGE